MNYQDKPAIEAGRQESNTMLQAPQSLQEGLSTQTLPTPQASPKSRSLLRKTPLKTTSHREGEDNYRGLLFPISDRWRAVVCKDGIQFILQYRYSPKPNTWRAKSYPVTREGLRESIGRLVFKGKPIPADITSLIDNLPDHVLDLKKGPYEKEEEQDYH